MPAAAVARSSDEEGTSGRVDAADLVRVGARHVHVAVAGYCNPTGTPQERGRCAAALVAADGRRAVAAVGVDDAARVDASGTVRTRLGDE